MNSNKLAITNFSSTNYISYESSMSQLSGDVFFIQLRLGNNIREQNDCHSTGVSHNSLSVEEID